MNVRATQSIYFHRAVYQPGDELEVNKDEAKSLMAQGLAERVQATKQEEQTPQTGSESSETSQPSKPLSKMNRTELEDFAGEIGMSDFEQYETVAILRKAIEDHQQNS